MEFVVQRAEGLVHCANGALFQQMIGRTVREAARRKADSVEAVSLLSVCALPDSFLF
jgi:hypothetical protein